MNEQIKNASKKDIVEAYQAMVQHGLDEFIGKLIKPSNDQKNYIKSLEENIKMAPYTLGYLEVLIIKKKKK